MKVLFFLFIFSSYSIVSELNLDQNFKAGDTVSAETFNTIFSTIEKINSVVKDEDLIGTWSCSGKGDGFNDQGYSNWTSDGKPSWYSISSTTSNITVTFASSGATSSYDTPYSYTQAEPILYQGKLSKTIGGETQHFFANLNGQYVLIDNKILLLSNYSGLTDTLIQPYIVSLMSPTRIKLKDADDNPTQTIICDKQ